MSIRVKNKKIKYHQDRDLTIFVLGVLFITSLIIYTGMNKTSAYKPIVKVDLNGSSKTVLSLNSQYVDEGIKVTIDDNQIDIKDVDYTVDNNINLSEIGEYEVIYHVNHEGIKYDVKRIVEVVDKEAPELVILTTKVSNNKCGNNLRFYAYDKYDGVLTDKVNVDEEETQYRLAVSDSSNNETVEYVTKSDIVNDYIMELKGTLIQYVKTGTTFEDNGVVITNLCGKEQNIEYTVEGNVDTNTPGEYTLKYISSNLDSYQIRKVIVYNSVPQNNMVNNSTKTIYLTFDDGPGQYTEELLNILAKYNVKATFFVTNQFKKYVPLIEREHNEGHMVALHTKTHNWNIYRSFENYYRDFNSMNKIIEEYTGEKTKIFRFPGGGSNTISRGKSLGVMNYAVSKMTELGYTYYDWNVDSEDAAGANTEKIIKNVTNGISEREHSIVLMHDIKKTTLGAIETIIKYGLDNGYTFEVLSNDTVTVHHHVNN